MAVAHLSDPHIKTMNSLTLCPVLNNPETRHCISSGPPLHVNPIFLFNRQVMCTVVPQQPIIIYTITDSDYHFKTCLSVLHSSNAINFLGMAIQ